MRMDAVELERARAPPNRMNWSGMIYESLETFLSSCRHNFTVQSQFLDKNESGRKKSVFSPPRQAEAQHCTKKDYTKNNQYSYI